MTTEIFWLHTYKDSAKLGLMARPRGNDWLEDEIINLKKEKVTVLVSLLESTEINELGLSKEESLCKNHGVEYINFPIPDRDIPKSNQMTKSLVSKLMDRLNSGNTIVIHCRMGIGRSSIISALLLFQMGYKFEEAINHISKIRRLKVPDTKEQIDWLRSRK